MKRLFNLYTSFFRRLFTIKNLSKFITMILIGIILRCFANDCINTSIFIEYIDLISIISGSVLSSLFIEPWLYIHCKLYGYGLATSYINNPNKSNVENAYYNQTSEQLFYQNYGENSTYNMSNNNQHTGFDSHYYDAQGNISISKPSELSNYNISSNTRKRIVSQLFEEIAQPTKFREVVVPCNNATGDIYLGIRYWDKPSNAYGLYVKYYNLFNQEYVWNIWEKDSNGLKFSQIENIIHPKVNIWKEIKDTTGTSVSKEVRKLLSTDPFHMNKKN
jgi:hypothetical protein